MELKVWVEGIQRIVCGVTETTTCQDVVFALAHATGKVGRFTLIEKWRNNERLLAPNENPLKILMKWGEYSSDVQFMLQRSDQQQQHQQQQSGSNSKPSPISDLKAALASRNAQKNAAAAAAAAAAASATAATIADNSQAVSSAAADVDKDLRKQFSPGLASNVDHQIASPRIADNVGIVRGIPQSQPPPPPPPDERNNPAHQQHQQRQQQPQYPSYHHHQADPSISSTTSNATTVSIGSNSSGCGGGGLQHIPNIAASSSSAPSSPLAPIEFNTADVRNSLDRKTSSAGLLAAAAAAASAASAAHNALDDDQSTSSGSAAASSLSGLYAQGPPISSNGALVPPPYRDPPPPRASPSGMGMGTTTTAGASFTLDALQHARFDTAALNTFVHVKDHLLAADAVNHPDAAGGVIFHNAQYRELIQLIKYQREKLTVQQADLGKFDAEIGYLEQREREQLQQLDAIARELGKADQMFRHGQEQLQQLQYVEEENELVHQQEKTLKSEITLLRSKLANCETELLQYKNKVRLLLDDIQAEQRAAAASATAAGGNPQLERHLMSEVERIQAEIDQAVLMAETAHQTADHLKQEVAGIESTIAEKKKQVEQLVNEMKEVNLQSLTAVAPSEEIHHLLEGSSRPGSTRRIIGSPRQLENAVPTSKNPHGVWV